jgi:hypothetical protein
MCLKNLHRSFYTFPRRHPNSDMRVVANIDIPVVLAVFSTCICFLKRQTPFAVVQTSEPSYLKVVAC